MLPLCLPKEINSLRYLSFFAIIFILFFVVCMVIHSAMNGLQEDQHYVLFQKGNKAITPIGNFLFCFGSQINYHGVASELYKPTIKRITLSATLGVVISFVVYAVGGLFGYLDFGAAVNSRSSLQLYNPIAEPLFAVCYVGMMFKLCVGYGMHMYPVRDAVYHFVGTNVHRVPWWLNCIVCTILATATLLCGLFIPKINLVFGLMGSLCSGFVGFVFPAWLYMYTGNWHLRTIGFFHYFATYLLLLVGIVGVIWGTAATIYADAVP
ncbi:amino acid transporter aATP11 [Angomonas deanei]|nr:amino acid transporter aATP11 [Angomonas deanei]|eukprot:EPY28361.1 amino acid transporter aATP11 [Angomonas deanei]